MANVQRRPALDGQKRSVEELKLTTASG